MITQFLTLLAIPAALLLKKIVPEELTQAKPYLKKLTLTLLILIHLANIYYLHITTLLIIIYTLLALASIIITFKTTKLFPLFINYLLLLAPTLITPSPSYTLTISSFTFLYLITHTLWQAILKQQSKEK